MEIKMQVLREIEAVLKKHGASLFFEAPAVLWMNGNEIGEIWHVEDSDGAQLEFVDPAKEPPNA
jgi:hypothetical protein